MLVAFREFPSTEISVLEIGNYTHEHLTACINQAAWCCFLIDLLEAIVVARLSIADVLA